MEKDNLIEDWLSQETTTEEREELERIIAFTENLAVPENKSKSQAWDQLLSNIEEQPSENEKVLVPRTNKPSTWLIWFSSVAAALVIGYFTLFKQSNGEITINTGIAQTTTQVLPDNSEIVLNAGSTITYDQKGWAETRQVALNGEAFFEVTEGTEFTVTTDAGKITVLGTSFNVFSRDEQLSVQCFTGKVMVEANEISVVLNASQSAAIDAQTGRLTVEDFNPDKTATWRIGEFYFDAVALSEVIAELERQFDIKVEVTGDISNRFYTGFFSTQNLTEALQLVFVPMGFTTTINGNTVTVE